MKKTTVLAFVILIGAILIPNILARPYAVSFKPPVTVQFYPLDGGHLSFTNMGIFYDTGEHEGESGEMAVPCYLIRHGEDWLLWDTGNGDDLIQYKDGVMKLGIRFSIKKTLKEQLTQVGLKPKDIKYVMLSHLHPDHSGNINLFPNAEFLVSERELKWALGNPTPNGVEAKLVDPLRKDHVTAIQGDTDVFGDGTIKMLRTPGHTPGHMSLFVKLSKAGNYLITGDLYHTKENYEKNQVDAGEL